MVAAEVLLISLGGLVIDYLLLAIVDTLPLLFMARDRPAYRRQFCGSQAAIADVTDPQERARNFGFISAGFGVGFIAGPVIGGLLGEMGARAPFHAAAALAALNFVYGLTLFPETLPPERRRRFDWRRANPWVRSARREPCRECWRRGDPRHRQIASLVYPLTWSFYAIAQYGWSTRTIGLSLAVVGVIMALSQIFLTGRAVERLGERNAASLGLVASIAAFVAYAFATQTWMAFPHVAADGRRRSSSPA